MNSYLQEKQEDFIKGIEFFKKETHALRVGRANPEVLDMVQVDAYGVRNQITGLASISVADARSLLVTPWDKSVLKDIEKAIVEANLGLGVVNDGEKLRLTVPMMTEENRKAMVKKLNEMMEDARINIRKIRDEVKTAIEAADKNKDISEDDKFRFIKELEEEVTAKNEEIKTLRDKKEVEIMTI
ncbi:MAG: ribosome recycling factor [bacterium]